MESLHALIKSRKMKESDDMTIDINAVAAEFTDFINEFHSYPQPYDSPMDIELNRQFADILEKQDKYGYFNFKKNPDGIERPFFSPSSAGKSERELYEKVLKSPKDTQKPQPHQRRWTAIGTKIGDMMQREILLAERHYQKFTGKMPRFRFARNAEGAPLFEEFTKTIHEVQHNGEHFGILGLGDGILEYISEDGEIINIGLEIKSKQQAYSTTNEKNMTEPKEEHRLQTVCYSEMYGLDYFFIVYVNASKKAWNMSPEEFADNPDFRVFGNEVTEDDRLAVFDKFAAVTKAAREGNPPPLDLTAWMFFEYKNHVAKTLTDEEFSDIRATANRAVRSGLPKWKKDGILNAYTFIKDVREAN